MANVFDHGREENVPSVDRVDEIARWYGLKTETVRDLLGTGWSFEQRIGEVPAFKYQINHLTS